MNKKEWKLVSKRLKQLAGKYPQKGLAGSTTDEELLLFIQTNRRKNNV